MDGVDALIGFGLSSPHVRGLLQWGLGRVATVMHLNHEDATLVELPVLRQFLRPHTVVTHSRELAKLASVRLGRTVQVVPFGCEQRLGSPAPGWYSVDMDRDESAVRAAVGDEPFLLWVRMEPGPSDQLLSAEPVGSVIVVSSSRPDGPRGARFLYVRGPSDWRLDGLVRGSMAVIASAGDMGDLALVSWLAGTPVIADRNSSVAAEVNQSAGGWVVDDERSFSEALTQAMSPAVRTSFVEAGRQFVSSRTWDLVIPDYEGVLTRSHESQAGSWGGVQGSVQRVGSCRE